MERLTCAAAIATRDRPESLARAMRSLLAQTRRPLQIILIDDGELSADWRDHWSARCVEAGVEFTYRRKPEPGRSASRNLSADLAEADFLFFLDDDCEPGADFVAKLLSPAEAAGGERLIALCGTVQPPGGERAGDRVYRVATRAIGWWALGRRRPSDAALPEGVEAVRNAGGVCMVRRDAFESERFDETLALGEDMEFSLRLARRGVIGRVAGATCLHHHEPGGRCGPFALGVRIARSYLYAQGKLFGAGGAALACLSLIGMSLMEAGFTLGGRVSHLARAGGILAGLLTPFGKRGEWSKS